MAGHMGDRQRTIQNLQVVAVDEDRGLIFIKGGLPGSKGKWISIKDSVKKAIPNDVPLPAGLKGSAVNIEKGKSIETELATPNEDVVVKPDEIKVENKEAKTESVSNVKDDVKSDNNVDENKEKEI
jgi:large subunit ribosomal protein L3